MLDTDSADCCQIAGSCIALLGRSRSPRDGEVSKFQRIVVQSFSKRGIPSRTQFSTIVDFEIGDDTDHPQSMMHPR